MTARGSRPAPRGSCSRTDEGIAVEELRSRNGTFLGDVRVERAIVPAGTRLRAGAMTIVIEDAGEIELPPNDPSLAVPDLVGKTGSRSRASWCRPCASGPRTSSRWSSTSSSPRSRRR